MLGGLKTTDGAFNFWWLAVTKGYVWADLPKIDFLEDDDEEGPEKRYRVLTPLRPEEMEIEVKRFNPLTRRAWEHESILWREFIDVPATEAGFLDFANRFGMLKYMNGRDAKPYNAHFIDHDYLESPLPGVKVAELLPASGETFDLWLEHHRALKWSFELCEAAHKAKDPAKSFFAELREKFGDAEPKMLEGQELRDYSLMLQDARTGKRVEVLHVALKRIIEAALQDNIRPLMLMDEADGDESTLKLYLSPKHLVAAMWIQFAQYVGEGQGLGQCEVCGRWFPLDRKYGVERKYCARPCQQEAYRRRKKTVASATTSATT